MIRLGVPPKGVIGSGVTISAPEAALHWRPEKAAVGTLTNYLQLRLETLLETPAITFDDLSLPPFSRYRWGIRQSGTYLPESLADALEELWEARLTSTAPKRPRSRKR